MMRKIIILFFATIMLTACANQQEETSVAERKVSPYLTITETTSEDRLQENAFSNCIVYNIETRMLSFKGQIPYTSQYPLTSYSSYTNSTYYSAYSGFGDQLYRFTENQSFQKTDNLSALNHIFQCGNNLFLAAKRAEHYCIEPFLYNLDDETLLQLFPDERDDRFTWTATCDPLGNQLFFSYYSDKTMRERLRLPIETATIPRVAPSTICSIDLATALVTPIYETTDYIWGIAANSSKLLYSGSPDALSSSAEHICYQIDLNTKEKTVLSLPVSISGDMAIWNNKLFCIGWKDNIRGVYSIDLESIETELIYETSENGFINGLSLNY